MKQRILFIVPYPTGEAPSQRFRFEQYFDILIQHGFEFQVHSFWDLKSWKILYKDGYTIQKFASLLRGFARIFLLLPKASKNDFIFIHREATPIGLPIWEWVIAKLLRKKIIYDFDDAIWLPDNVQESLVSKVLKWRNKVASICRWSYKVSCGNHFLCSYSEKFNKNTFYNPTTVDTQRKHNPDLVEAKKASDKICIGWTGSHSTIKYLADLEPVFKRLAQTYSNLSFIVIADQMPSMNIPNLHFIQWSKETEIVSLAKFDIGVMPLPDEPWTTGKCGFKLLQYLSMGIPAIASPVGVNSHIIKNDVTGYLCSDSDEWFVSLRKLIENPTLRKQMGKRGREFVVENYSVASNSVNFLRLFE